MSRFVSPGTLLDVGSAAGFFVSEASRAGWDARGIDISADMVSWGVERLGVDLVRTSLAEERSGRTESCITMWDYIEHSIDPRGDVERALARLRPGVYSHSRRVTSAPFSHESRRDGGTSSRRGTRTTSSRRRRCAGYSRRSDSTGSRSTTLLRLPAPVPRPQGRSRSRRLGRTCALAPSRRFACRLVGIPVNLWDVMTVIARRPAATKAEHRA